MKKTSAAIVLAITFLSCSTTTLKKEEAESILRRKLQLPGILNYNIETSNPACASQLISAGLEAGGFVTIEKEAEHTDAGQPVIRFTEKARPFLHAGLPQKNSGSLQAVRVAYVDIGEITCIKIRNPYNLATVEYTITYHNLTPFASLLKAGITRPATKKAMLSLRNNSWKMEK